MYSRVRGISMANYKTRHNRLSDEERVKLGEECVKLHEEFEVGWSEIAHRKGVSYNTVIRWVDHYKGQV